MSAFPLRKEVEYPSSDGKPMAETDVHRDEMVYVIEGLRSHFRDVPDVYVSGNILLYYVKGNPRSSVSPDGLVAKGLSHAKERRDVYKVWEEGRPPSWVIEVTSRSTRLEDLDRKKSLYQRLGIEEYFLYDPRSEYLDPPLQGYRLSGGRYQPISPEPDGSLVSQVLDMVLSWDESGLQLVDAQTGEALLSYSEQREARELEAAARQAAEAARQVAEAACQAAEGRAAEESVAREVAEAAREVAEAAREVAEERAAQEAAARRALEEELARLRLDLERGK